MVSEALDATSVDDDTTSGAELVGPIVEGAGEVSGLEAGVVDPTLETGSTPVAVDDMDPISLVVDAAGVSGTDVISATSVLVTAVDDVASDELAAPVEVSAEAEDTLGVEAG